MAVRRACSACKNACDDSSAEVFPLVVSSSPTSSSSSCDLPQTHTSVASNLSSFQFFHLYDCKHSTVDCTKCKRRLARSLNPMQRNAAQANSSQLKLNKKAPRKLNHPQRKWWCRDDEPQEPQGEPQDEKKHKKATSSAHPNHLPNSLPIQHAPPNVTSSNARCGVPSTPGDVPEWRKREGMKRAREG